MALSPMLLPTPTSVPTTARGPLMPSPAMAMAVEAMATVDAATAVATTARGRLRPSPATVMAVEATAMVDVATAVATTARGRLRPSPATAMDVAMEATAVATAGTTVELRSKRSELSLCEDRSVFHENSTQKVLEK